MTNPLDIVSALFSDKNFIYNMTYESAKQNIFIILRRLAIMYPEQANVFNNAKINPLDAVRFWSDYLFTGKKPPYWVYTPGAVKTQAKSSGKITKQEIDQYLSFNKMSRKDFDSAMRLFPDDTVSEVKEISNLLKKLNSSKLE